MIVLDVYTNIVSILDCSFTLHELKDLSKAYIASQRVRVCVNGWCWYRPPTQAFCIAYTRYKKASRGKHKPLQT